MIVTALVLLFTLTQAISFDLPGYPAGDDRGKLCLKTFVGQDVLVTGTIKLGPGNNQQLSSYVTDGSQQIWAKNAIVDEAKLSFRTHLEPRDYQFCFVNVVSDSSYGTSKRTVSFDMQMVLDRFEDSKPTEKLKPIEAEVKRMEQVLATIKADLEYLQRREGMMRNTNESTNDRVKWFSLFSIVTLIGLGLWQMYYLKQFFHSKKLI